MGPSVRPRPLRPLPPNRPLAELARVLARTEGQAYVHYLHQDKRMDGYVPAGSVRLADAALQGAAELDDELAVDAEEAAVFGDAAAGTLTEEEYDILHHKQIGARRNFDNVYFRTWEIRTWCVCPPAAAGRGLMRGLQVLGAVPNGGRRARQAIPDGRRRRRAPQGRDLAQPHVRPARGQPRARRRRRPARLALGVRRLLQVHDGRRAVGPAHRASPAGRACGRALTDARAEKVRAEGAARSQGLPARRAHHLGDRRREGEGAGSRGGRARRTLMRARSCTART
jgi:hypothetical protein